ncbi:MAG: hypothetical protein K9L56_15370 [Clostridiales bacterium]|nr:hypothetical protein [Clostridiales bacterium]
MKDKYLLNHLNKLEEEAEAINEADEEYKIKEATINLLKHIWQMQGEVEQEVSGG